MLSLGAKGILKVNGPEGEHVCSVRGEAEASRLWGRADPQQSWRKMFQQSNLSSRERLVGSPNACSTFPEDSACKGTWNFQSVIRKKKSGIWVGD